MFEKIFFIVGGWISVNIIILYLKFYSRGNMGEDPLSGKIYLLIQIPLIIILCLLSISFFFFYNILAVITIVCIVLGIYLGFRGKKSATEPVEAEIININCMSTSSKIKGHSVLYLLTVRYYVDGIEYVSQNTEGFLELDENMRIGNKIMIKYNPKNPNDIAYYH